MFWCRTLGELALYADREDPVPIIGACKSLVLVVYVAMSPRRTATREHVCALFWPGTSRSNASHALRQSLYRLREITGRELFLRHDSLLQVDPSVLLDCLEAERALDQGDFHTAVGLLDGSFLPGFSLNGSQELEEWAESQRARFRGCFVQAAEAEIQNASARGEFADAISLAEDVCAGNPLEERAVDLLIRTLAEAGQIERALAEYNSYDQLVRSAVDGEPSRGLTEHVESLASADFRSVVQASGDSDEERSSVQRFVKNALIAGLAAGALGLGALLASASKDAEPMAFHQGTIFLWRPNRSGTDGELYRVVWPERSGASASLTPVPTWPAELDPPLMIRPVESDKATHPKVFKYARSGGLIELTKERQDENDPVWSPDRRWIAIQRTLIREGKPDMNVIVVDSSGRWGWEVTASPSRHNPLNWSPDGSRLTLLRVENGTQKLLVADADGGRIEDLSEALGLGTSATWSTGFSPDGAKLAVALQSGRVSIYDIEQGSTQWIDTGRELLKKTPLWSPDGEWLAVTSTSGKQALLLIIPVDGHAGANPLVSFGPEYWTLAWSDGLSDYVADVEIDPKKLQLETGRGATLAARATGRSGKVVYTGLKWAVLDPNVAWIDQWGFLKGREAGRTHVVTSAGGFRADTVAVEVVATLVDRLLRETWNDRIDPRVWAIVGTPEPYTVGGVMPDGAPALLSNGDHNWPSGVLSEDQFPLQDGLTLELKARFHFSGKHWQEFEAALVPLKQAFTEEGRERDIHSWIAGWWFGGPSPDYSAPVYGCSSAGTVSTGSVQWPISIANSGWHSLVLQIRPDWRLECYLDSKLVAVLEIPGSIRVDSAAVYLGGRTHETQIYHGPVTLTRGLRY